MNDRIRELFRQSHLDVYGLGKDKELWEMTVNRFAELIINECAEHAKMYMIDNNKGNHMMRPSHISDYITHKMGIE